jgi:hypothetical protein
MLDYLILRRKRHIMNNKIIGTLTAFGIFALPIVCQNISAEDIIPVSTEEESEDENSAIDTQEDDYSLEEEQMEQKVEKNKKKKDKEKNKKNKKKKSNKKNSKKSKKKHQK